MSQRVRNIAPITAQRGSTAVFSEVPDIFREMWGMISPVSFMLSHDLDVLALGENTAGSLGMNVSAVRFVCLTAAAVLAGKLCR